MATQLTHTDDQQQRHPIVVLRAQLEQRAEEFRMVLPAHITPEKLQRTVITAAQQNPKIMQADRRSLITACMKAANDALLPDGREAALVPFKTRVKDDQGRWGDVWLVQYMPMVYGLRKKILQSGEIRDIQTAVVYRQEIEAGLFIYEEGTERMLRHKPLLDPTFDPRDEDIAAAYSIATFDDGSKSFEVMRRAEINKIRECSQTGALRDKKGNPREPSGPWVDWFSEQARKVVMRRHSKTLPMSGDILDVEAADEARYAQSAVMALSAPEAQPATLPSRSETAAIAHNPDTDEVLDDETLARLDRESLRQMDGDDGLLSDENPAAREGRADSDMGEAHTGDLLEGTRPTAEPKRTAASFVDGLIAQFRAARSGMEIQQITTDNADEIERLETSAPKQHARLLQARDEAWDALNG